MHVSGRFSVALCLSIVLCAGQFGSAQSWKPTLHDADELYDAAEDLHDRAERFNDGHTLQVTAELEHLTADLYQLLKRNGCAADVVALLNTTGAVLEQASVQVNLSCHLRTDRKAQSELANAQRYFNATAERIQCALRDSLPSRPAYHAPVWQAPVPSWYQLPPAPQPYGYEVRYLPPEPSPTRALVRVRVQSVR